MWKYGNIMMYRISLYAGGNVEISLAEKVNYSLRKFL
jgi:hypothetical protein